MDYLGIKLFISDTAGLCNQLYSLNGGIQHAINNNIKLIFIDSFLREIKSNKICNISNVINLKKTNEKIKNYNIILCDLHDFKFNVVNIKYGNETNSIDITSEFNQLFTQDKIIKISPIYNFRKLKSLPLDFINNNLLNSKLFITIQIDDYYFNYTYPMVNGFVRNGINLDYNNINSQYFNRYTQNEIFNNLTDAYVFNKEISNKAIDFIKSIDINQKINIVHLRLENDAMEHWSKENKQNIINYKKTVENKYISLINKYFKKDELTLLLAHDYNNRVIDYLRDNNYNYITTPLLDNDREIAALIDLHIGQFCNNHYLFILESSFSFSLMYRIYNKKNVKFIMFEFNNLNKVEDYFKFEVDNNILRYRKIEE